MRVFAFVLFLALASVAMGQTQTTITLTDGPLMSAPVSAEYSRSFGVLRNELDRAMSPSSEFGTLDKILLIGGLENLALASATGTTNIPWMGAYIPGEVPFSFSLKLDQGLGVRNDGNASLDQLRTGTYQTSITAATSKSYTVTSGTTTTTGNGNYTSADTYVTYNHPVPLTTTRNEVHTLFGLKGEELNLNTGLWLLYSAEDAAVANDNTTTVSSTYGDSKFADLTVAPSVVTIRKQTTTAAKSRTWNNLSLYAPVAFSDGELEHTGGLGLGYSWHDGSSSTDSTGNEVITQTPALATQFIGAGPYSWTSQKLATKLLSNYILGAADWKIETPDWAAKVEGKLVLPALTYSSTDFSKTSSVTNANLGVSAPTTTQSDSTTTLDSTSQPTYEASLGVNAKVFFPLAEGMTFSFNPGASARWNNKSIDTNVFPNVVQGQDFLVSKKTTTTKADNTGDGLYTAAADSTTTTVTEYTNAALNVNTGLIEAQTAGILVDGFVALPMALKLNPKGWPFHFVVASQTNVWASWKTMSKLALGRKETVTTVTGDSSATTVTTNVFAPATTTSTVYFGWSTWTNYSLLTQIDFTDDIKLDMSVPNLLAFDTLKLQLRIALPAPKAEAEAPVEPAPVAAAPAPAGPPAGVPAVAPAPVAAPTAGTTQAPAKTTTTTAPATGTTTTKAPATTTTKKP